MSNPSPASPPPPPRRIPSFRLTLRLFSYARPYAALILVTVTVIAGYSALYSGRAVLLRPFMNEALVPADWERLQSLFVLALALTAGVAVLDFVQSYLTRYIMYRVLVDLRNDVFGHILRLSMRFFSGTRAGDLMSRLTSDIGVTQNALEFVFGDLLLQPFLILGALATAFYLNWQLAAAVCLGFPLFWFPIAALGKGVRRSKKRSLVELGSLTEAMHQMLTGIRIVKSFRMEHEEHAEFAARNERFLGKSLKVIRNKALSEGITELLNALGLTAVVFVGGYFMVQGLFGLKLEGNRPDLGTFVAFLVVMVALNRPVKVLTRSFNTLQESLAGAERVFEIMDLKPEIEDVADAVDCTRVSRSIEFREVSFAYGAEPVLRKVSVQVKPGEVVAIVGPSGAGKSTLLDLLCRFYDPTEGAVEVDGVDLRRLRHESLLDHVAVVTQDTFLFNTTVADNIRYGRRGAVQSEIEAAARAANIHEFILTLPLGYETVVGERGAQLSGGQRQRIAIARALLKNPNLLLLDEATSALDTESEQIVQEALNALMRGRTTFVIAHRLSTVQHADQVLVLEEGRIVESGRHEELLRRNGVYAKMWARQSAPVAIA
ncbi:MAG: ABC transporter ATP-binding protein [Planctomycetes bacterium]|nr:ABC transporter ATP-binding protein [Planctomycetota bacterium]